MASVIKAGKKKSLAAVKPFHNNVVSGANGLDLNRVITAAEREENIAITTLRAENEKLKSEIEQLKIENEQAVAAARKGGEEAASERITQDYEKGYECLVTGVEKSLQHLEDKLSSLDGLALLIAQTALEKVFLPDGDYCELVSRMITKQMQGLRRESILSVRVSGQDFESDEALENLSVTLDLRQADIKIQETLRAGDCVIDLRLGHMELSVKDQWKTLQTLFCDMAADEELL